MNEMQENSWSEELKKFMEKYVASQVTRTYSTQEVADWIGVAKKTLRKYMEHGKIEYFQDNAVIRFEREDVQNFLAKHKRNGI